MGLSTFASFDGPDLVAFLVCGLIGFFAGTFAPPGPAALYTTILVSYHLFLGWLVFVSNTSQKRAGVSLPLLHTVVTHVACVLVVISPVFIAVHSGTIPSMGPPAQKAVYQASLGGANDPSLDQEMEQMHKERNALRFLQALCSSMAGLALFERRWLFSAEKEAPRAKIPEPTPGESAIRATHDDAVEWSRYLAQQSSRSRKPGASLKDEYEKWLAERHKE